MADAIIGALRVVLGADSAALDKGLRQAQSNLSSFAKDVTKIAAGIQFQKMFDTIVQGFQNVFQEADKLGKAAQSVGGPIEDLGLLKHAADLAGGGLDQLSSGMQKLARTMVESVQQPSGKAATAFKALGIEVRNTDGTFKTTSQVMIETIQRFETLEDGTAKTRVAMDLFGKSGAALIPLLNTGSAELEEMKKEMADLGLVITDKTFRAAEAFNDNLRRLQLFIKGIFLATMAELSGSFQSATDSMVKWARESGVAQTVAGFLAKEFKSIIVEIKDVQLFIEQLGRAFVALRKLFTEPFNIVANWQNLQETIELNRLSTEAFNTQYRGMGELAITVGEQQTKAAKKTTQAIDEQLAKSKEAKNAFQSFLDTTAKSIVTQQAEFATVGMVAGAKEKLRIVEQGLLIARQNNIVVTDAMRIKLEELAGASANAALKLQGAQLTEEMLHPWQTYEQQLRRLNELLAAGAINQDTYARAAKKAADDSGMSWSKASASIADSFTELAGAFGDSQSTIAKTAKIFAAATALINVVLAQSYALAAPFPANLVAMATVAAKGAALIAAIKSAVVPTKAQMGGLFKVPGGVSLTDNKFVPMNLAAGEQVEITPADKADRRATPAQINLTIPNELVSREYMRKMFDEINAMIRDGYQIKLAPAV